MLMYSSFLEYFDQIVKTTFQYNFRNNSFDSNNIVIINSIASKMYF